jgi:hypothetical protein
MAGSEEWRPIEGFEGLYEVSNLGRFRNAQTGLIRRTQAKAGTGYRIITLMKNGRCNTRSVHRLVAHAFLGPRPDGLQCAHLSGDPGDNRAANLAYTTAKENNSHKHLHGTAQMGERHNFAKMTEADVLHIRATVRDWKGVLRHYVANAPRQGANNARNPPRIRAWDTTLPYRG